MRFPRNRKIFRGQVDPAPYAGVFFLLLILLLLSSSLVFTPGVPIRLPAAADLPGAAQPNLVVAVDASGQFYYENQLMDAGRLRQKLQAALGNAREPFTLVIQADQATRYDVLVRLGLLAREAGIKAVYLATRPAVVPVSIATPVE
jgi:biopolymer transport protein ExbD